MTYQSIEEVKSYANEGTPLLICDFIVSIVAQEDIFQHVVFERMDITVVWKLSELLIIFMLFQNGVEFVLVYSEDPQTILPSYLLDMLATSGNMVVFFCPTFQAKVCLLI